MINVFEVPVAQVEDFIAQWRVRATIMSKAPGFRDLRLHRAISTDARFQVVNVARWDSKRAWQAAVANPEFQAPLHAHLDDPDQHFSASPALYHEVITFGDHTPG